MMALGLTEVDTPALVVDRSRMLRNIQAMARAMEHNGVTFRPHFKTSKMIEVAKLQLAEGAVGMTCATREEVQALIDGGIDDIFWANSTATKSKAAFAAEANRKATVAVGLDSFELGTLLSEASQDASTSIPVLLEIDTGLRRTGVQPERAQTVAEAVSSLPGVDLIGVYMHEGQLASLRTTREELRQQGLAAASILVDVAEGLRQRGFHLPRVSVGSTPGWDSAPLVSGVTEARPGTYVFFDANSVRLESAGLEQCAATVLTSVVSRPFPGQATIDAGIKAMSSDRSNRDDSLGLVVGLHSLAALEATFERAYEEHGILEGSLVSSLAVSDRVRVVPNHACGVVNMWSQVHILDGDMITETWKTVGRH